MMKKFFGLSLALWLTSCSGIEPLTKEEIRLVSLTHASINNLIVKGKSTKECIRNHFGDPALSDVIDATKSKWYYKSIHSTSNSSVPMIYNDGYRNKVVRLMILFENDIAVNYELNIKDVPTKHVALGGSLPKEN